MVSTYFVANLTDSPDIEQLYQLFHGFGAIQQFKLIHKKLYQRNWTYAFVKMPDDSLKPSLLRHFNGYEFQGRRLALSCIKPLVPLELTPESQQLIDRLGTHLRETEKTPLKYLEQIVIWCGADFANALLEETLQMEMSGGLLTLDRSRRRTPGGVFFYLAKPRIYWLVAEKIFPQLKAPESEKKANPVPREAYEAITRLRHSEQVLAAQLYEMQNTRNTAGMFSLTKQLADIKQKIAQLRRDYPDL